MNTSFFLSEGLYAIIYVIAFMVMREFYISKNGLLRKIMITYFAAVGITFLFAAIYAISVRYGVRFINADLFKVVVLLPKALAMLWLLWYLKRGRKSHL